MNDHKKKKKIIYGITVLAGVCIFGAGFFVSRKMAQADSDSLREEGIGAELSDRELEGLFQGSGLSAEGEAANSTEAMDSKENQENFFIWSKQTPDLTNAEKNQNLHESSDFQQNQESQNNDSPKENSDSDKEAPVPDKDYAAIVNPVVMLDPGHGGIDNGCEIGNIREKDVNFSIALKTKELLEGMGYTVVMTHDTDVKVFLTERVQSAIDANAAVFVSIHQNLYDGSEAESVAGIESYYNSYHSPEGSKKLANLVHSKVVANTSARDRGVQHVDNLVVVVKTTCPSVLIETGFLSNSAERELLLSEDYQNKIASGIADAIQLFFTE